MSDAQALEVKIDSLTKNKDDETPVIRSSELHKIRGVSKSGILLRY